MIPNEVLRQAAERSLLDERRLNNLWAFAKEASASSNGPIVEFGSYKGGSALVLQAAIDSNHGHNPLHLFDTFEGIPFGGPNDSHKKGDFGDTNLERVREILPKAIFHKGDFVEQFHLVEIEMGRIAFAHIDVDQEASTLIAVEYCWKYLMEGAWIVIDDYNAEACLGARQAVGFFLHNLEPHTFLFLEGPHPQAFIRKVRHHD